MERRSTGKPRVYHVTDVFPPSIGGIETALATLLPRLRGTQSVVLVDSADAARVYPRISDAVVVPVSGNRGVWSCLFSSPVKSFLARSPAGFAALLLNMAKEQDRTTLIMEASGASVLHLHGLGWMRRFNPAVGGARGSFNAMIFRRFFRLARYLPANLYTDHSLFSGSYDRFIANGGPAFLAHARAVVVVERSGFDNATRWVKESGGRNIVRLIPNPIDLRRFAWRPPRRDSEFTLAYVGRTSKPGLGLVDTLWDSAPDGARLVLCLAGNRDASVGPDSPLGKLLKLPAVSVYWNVSQEEMPKILASVDVLLDPFEVGTPRTTIEALAVGRPVIRFRSSVRDVEPLIADEVAPFVLDSEPTRAWDLVEAWHTRLGEHLRVCERAREFAVATFDADMIAAQYLALYGDLLGYPIHPVDESGLEGATLSKGDA